MGGPSLKRETERAEILALLAAGEGSLVLQGDPGTGKTALLSFARANADGLAVLECRGCEEERGLDRGALADLLGGRLPRQSDPLGFHRAVIAELERRRPVLCLVDDAHALDRSSLDTLGFVARRVNGRGIVILLTSCASSGLIGVPRRKLGKWDESTARSLLADLRPELTEPAIAVLLDLADGNPRALTELAASGVPRFSDDSEFVRSYASRWEVLPAGTKWLLLLAAADEELDAAGLIRAAALSNVDIEELAPAERCGLLRVRGQRLEFAHPVARILAYERPELAQRRAAHLLLARLNESDRHGLRRAVHLAALACEPDPSLAKELERAARREGGYAQASTALERAAELTEEESQAASRMVAAARYAWLSGRPRRACRLLTQARQLADQGSQARGQVLAGEIELRTGAASSTLDSLLSTADRYSRTDRAVAVTALMRAAEAVCFSGDYGRFSEISQRAERLRRPDDPPGAELVFQTIDGFGATFLGRHDRAAPPLRRVIALAARAGDVASLTASAAAGLLLADDHAAHRAASAAVRDARSRGEVAALPLALEMRAVAEYWLGRFDAAESTSREGWRAAARSGQSNYAGDHLAMFALLAALRGERAECLRRLRELAMPAGAGRINRAKALSLWARAVLDLLVGRPAAAYSRIASIADPLTGQGNVVVQTMALPWLVEAAALTDSGEHARPFLENFERWARSTGDPARCALAHRCFGLLAPRGSEAARHHFDAALESHGGSESDYERARTELLYGRRLRRERRPSQAREHLRSALETFERLGFSAWVEQARGELRFPAGRQPVTLTAQQLRIAQLAAGGATNREIGQSLFLSTRTVDHHMRNIFVRLGIRSRVELVAHLSELGSATGGG